MLLLLIGGCAASEKFTINQSEIIFYAKTDYHHGEIGVIYVLADGHVIHTRKPHHAVPQECTATLSNISSEQFKELRKTLSNETLLYELALTGISNPKSQMWLVPEFGIKGYNHERIPHFSTSIASRKAISFSCEEFWKLQGPMAQATTCSVDSDCVVRQNKEVLEACHIRDVACEYRELEKNIDESADKKFYQGVCSAGLCQLELNRPSCQELLEGEEYESLRKEVDEHCYLNEEKDFALRCSFFAECTGYEGKTTNRFEQSFQVCRQECFGFSETVEEARAKRENTSNYISYLDLPELNCVCESKTGEFFWKKKTMELILFNSIE